MSDRRRYAFEGTEPEIHEDAHVSRESTLVGEVAVAADASVWPGVVLRGDVGPVRIGESAHVGDNATIHASSVGARVMCGHGAVLNDAAVREGSLVGFNATLNSDVVVGRECIVASGTTVPDGYDIPDRSFVRGVPASVTPLSETTIDPAATFEEYSSGAYTNLAERHGALFE
ncbi:gamma carbonic anhydrase family protein [Natrononativus amylolyticus]|uniref:gamma carbonic anhydrase family protein n=1 Tax=Natrononativus amylolyticus TaxID=2963434 RepID=UPI0020CBCB83|nr:gamma carbonic anhydrase family protein [Natrononativus amylolyticus]